MSEYSSSTQFIDLESQQKLIRLKIDKAISKVLDHGQYIMGPEVKDFEDKLKEYTGAKHVISCANGTDALSLILMAWNIGQGDAVFVPSFTYVATAEAPAQLGATPFFVDVCEETFNLDTASFKQAIFDCKKLGLKPAAVIPVDLFGQPCDIDEISEIAWQERVRVLVDAAQSFGAIYKGRTTGTLGDATATSFFPAKPLGCYGDGGAVFSNNDMDAEIINSIRLHGKGKEKYENVRIGINSRLDTLQAAILLQKIEIFPQELELREKAANYYMEHEIFETKHPIILEDSKSAWAQYTLKTNIRGILIEALKKSSIPSAIYYPKSLNQQEGYKKYPSVKGGTPISEKLAKNVLSLPMHPYIKKPTQKKIIDALNSERKK
jgi:dTDP-4-amino-4,6-dideoxygalactose transaminase